MSRPLAVEDRRRVVKPGWRRALRSALAQGVRCPECNRSGALRLSGGHLGTCRSCAAWFDLRPTFTPRPRPGGNPHRWVATVHPQKEDSRA